VILLRISEFWFILTYGGRLIRREGPLTAHVDAQAEPILLPRETQFEFARY
jgi:hypothetical protein